MDDGYIHLVKEFLFRALKCTTVQISEMELDGAGLGNRQGQGPS